jgi:hypothetical protein
MFIIDLAVGDKVVVGDVTFTLKVKKGVKARIAIDKPSSKSVEAIRAVDVALGKAREKSIFPIAR